MKISVDESTSVTVVTLSGELDIATIDPVRSVLDSIAHTGGQAIVDLSELSFCGCAGVRVLLAFQRELAEPGQTVFAGCTRAVLRVMDVAGVRPLFDLAETVEQGREFLRGTVLI